MLHRTYNASEGRNATQQKQIEPNDSKTDANKNVFQEHFANVPIKL